MKRKKLLSYEAKVILTIILILAVIFSPISILDTLENIKLYILDFYKQNFGKYPVWVEVSILLSPIVLFLIYKLIRKNRSTYTQDMIYNINWTWKWRGDNITNLQCFCPDCQEELFYDDTTSNYVLTVSKIDFICEKCQKVVGSIHNENKKRRSQMNVKREIERVINKRAETK